MQNLMFAKKIKAILLVIIPAVLTSLFFSFVFYAVEKYWFEFDKISLDDVFLIGYFTFISFLVGMGFLEFYFVSSFKKLVKNVMRFMVKEDSAEDDYAIESIRKMVDDGAIYLFTKDGSKRELMEIIEQLYKLQSILGFNKELISSIGRVRTIEELYITLSAVFKLYKLGDFVDIYVKSYDESKERFYHSIFSPEKIIVSNADDIEKTLWKKNTFCLKGDVLPKTFLNKNEGIPNPFKEESVNNNSDKNICLSSIIYGMGVKGFIVFKKGKGLTNVEKAYVSILGNIVINTIKHLTEIEKVRKEGMIDNLTGVYNRVFLNRKLIPMIKENIANGYTYSVASIDIDHFKSINDAYGHLGGDYVLKNLAKVVVRNIKKSDYFIRYGGEEFILIVKDDIDGAICITERIRKKIEEEKFIFNIDGVEKKIKVTVSAGVAPLTNDFEKSYKQADDLLYIAKKEGRNKVEPSSVDCKQGYM